MIEKILSIIINIFITISIVLFMLFMGVRLAGYTPYVVTSGSMIPQYPVGSLIYVHKVDFHDLHIGDDITFYLSGESIATHRIHEIDNNAMTVQTYGINNKTMEGEYIIDGVETQSTDIIGKVCFSLPYLGTVYWFIDSLQGKIVIVGMIVLLFMLSFFSKKYLHKWEVKEDGKEEK